MPALLGIKNLSPAFYGRLSAKPIIPKTSGKFPVFCGQISAYFLRLAG